MEVVKSKNKQKADEVMYNNNNNNKKNQNDEIINKNASNEQKQQQKKKGNNSGSGSGNGNGSNKKKKNKQKNSHNNDKIAPHDDEMSKQQEITLPTATTTTTVEEIICNDDKHHNNNGNDLLSASQENIDNKVVSHSTPLNKPFIAPLAAMSTTTTTTTTIINENNADINVDNNNDALCCPLTPRRIVDVQTKDEGEPQQIYDLKKSNTINSINNQTDHTNEVDNDFHYDDEDYDDGDNGLLVQFLDEANKIAEAKLAQRRQARVEAREIRMRELERQQKEQEQNADRVFDLHANSTGAGGDALSRTRLNAGMASLSINSVLNSTRANSMCSRRSSEDSLEEEGRSLRDIRHELKDVEDRFRKAMIANAQLDNERASQTYQIQLLKDKLEEMEESYAQLQREFKDKSKECSAFKRQLDKVSEELKLVQGQLNERDTLIAEQGLVIVAVENEDGSDARRALVTVENAQLLGSVQGSLDVRLKKFSEEKQQLISEVQRLQDQLDNYKSHGKQRSMTNGPLSDDEYEAQREANKIISDYKYKLQKAEQEIASLQSSLARSETQVIRYKSTAEAAEKAEAELKIERRKLQRENREASERLEELETENHHLLKRMDKLKNVKSALLKDL